MTAAALPATLDGPFDPDRTLADLSRTGLARLAREIMLISMLHDRALMPHVAGRGGTAASIVQADDEWMAASPIYTARNKENLGIVGDGVDAVLKSFQFDIGSPHHFLDLQGEVVDHDLGYFWLTSCGAHDYVRWVSGGDEKIVSMMCHDMEDRTFDATLRATNPRARCVPVHRPPKPEGFEGEPCRWRVEIAPDDLAVAPDHPHLERLWGTAAAGFRIPLGESREPGGLEDYSGPYVSGLRLDDLSHAVLVRQVAEFALDVHLLMRAGYLSILERYDEAFLRQVVPEHLAALTPPMVRRLTDALGIEGDGPEAIASVLQIHPLLPPGYVDHRVEIHDDDTVEVVVEPCAALDDRELPSPLDTLADDEPAVLVTAARAVNPRARITPVGERRWRVRIDPEAEPAAEHPMAELVGGFNYLPADLRARPVPVALRRAAR